MQILYVVDKEVMNNFQEYFNHKFQMYNFTKIEECKHVNQ